MNNGYVTKQDLAEAVAHLASKQDLADAGGVFKQDLAELRGEFKQDLAELRGEFKQDLAELRGEFKLDLEHVTNTLTETIRDAQTEVLRAFYNWARPMEIRLNRVDDVNTRLSLIEERLAALERGKFPGA